MAVSIPNTIKKQLDSLLTELDKRSKKSRLLTKYLDGNSPPPDAIVRARVTKTYRNLMPVAEAPWADLIVGSTQDRLEVSGIKSEDSGTDKIVWDAWQTNQMDAEAKLGQSAALVDGRAFALVWRPPGSSDPEISLDDSSTMIVQYAEGSRRRRVAALRRWVDEDDVTNVTLYGPDYVWKFRESKEQVRGQGRVKAGDKWWEARDYGPDVEAWPLENPWGVVPVVEVAINRRLRPGCFPFARGEFEHCLGLIDRINLLTFLGLVVAFWMGFPLRGVIGEVLKKDDDGEIIPPFDAHATGLAILENPDAKTFEYSAADHKNLSVFAELDQLSTITKTPRHYFPLDQGFSNLSADAIRASEGALHAKVTSYKATMGEGWEEVLRLCGLMSDAEVILSPRAELKWKDHESRSMAEKADAASKLKDILPWQLLGEKVLNLTQQEIDRAQVQQTSGVFADLVKGLNDKQPAEPAKQPVAA